MQTLDRLRAFAQVRFEHRKGFVVRYVAGGEVRDIESPRVSLRLVVREKIAELEELPVCQRFQF